MATAIELTERTTLRRGDLQYGVDAAVEHLWKTQRADGSWESFCDVGPVATAQMVVTLKYMGRLDSADAALAARWLIGQQRSDGSWVSHPFAEQGDLGTTATAWAALHAAGVPADSVAIWQAQAYIDTHGGMDAVIRGVSSGNLAALNLAIAGLIDPRRLPRLPIAQCLIPQVRSLLERRFNGAIQTLLLEAGIIARRLRGDWGPDGQAKPPLDEQACRHCLALLDEFQNSDGSWWNGVTPWSGLILATLHAMALPEGAERIERGLPSIERYRVHEQDGLHWLAFGDSVWTTAFNLRALLAAGVSADHPNMVRAADWLLASQIQRPQSHLNNRRAEAPRTGGWAFRRSVDGLPDVDDAAVVITVLNQFRERIHDQSLATRIRAAVESGVAWMLGMQNRDGGWGAFVCDLGEKPLGPWLAAVPNVDVADPAALASVLFEPPPELGDPATEDLTARTLHALAASGLTADDPAVHKAIEFLRTHQLADGSWWGRWTGNYVPATAFALIGLHAVGADPMAPWIRRAIDWLVSKQNADGGWGESHLSYRQPELAGVSQSMPPVTGLVLAALCKLGWKVDLSVQRGICYLLEQQRPDGTWDNGDFLHGLIPPDTFYYVPAAPNFWALEGLGEALRSRDETQAPRTFLPKCQTDAFLDEMRLAGDPSADKAVGELFAYGAVGEINMLIGKLAQADRPLPRGLPPTVAEYFRSTAILPNWADPERMGVAQSVFARYGWEVSLGLFCASLPQGYAAGSCARCMGRTRVLIDNAPRRIFETAQFLFDVLDEDGLTPSGRGIRSCQKVRLMHGALRRLFAGEQDVARDGNPVNQEDMLGTLLLFSVSTLDTLRKLEVPLTKAEEEAWIHTWAVVGHLLGVDSRLLPGSVADAEAKLLAYQRRRWEATPQGRELAGALVALMQSYYPEPFAQVPIALIRYFSGARCADLLGLPKVDWAALAVNAGIWLSAQWANGELHNRLGAFAGQVAQRVMKSFLLLQTGGQLNWADLLSDVSRAMGMLAPNSGPGAGEASPLRHLAYWLMKGLVLTERDGRTAAFHMPAALGAGSAG